MVKNGTTGYNYVVARLPRAQLLQLADQASCVLEVIQGKADAFVYDQMSIYQFHKDNPQTTRAILTPVQHEDWAVGVRKGNDALRQQVNAFLSDFKAKHGLDALGAKYLRDPDAFKEMGNPFS